MSPHDPETAASAALSAQLEASLVRELKRTWHQINRSHFKRSLRTPVIALTQSRALLGRWDRTRRSIELSLPLLLSAPWGAVVEVLKHEMAHQYVHEVLGAVDDAPHGRAFREVCARVGIDPAARGLPEAEPHIDTPCSQLLRRVGGLLALAESPNQHEAETAAAMARRLMLKHNIALSRLEQTQRYGSRHLGRPSGRVAEAQHLLAAILADHYFVEAIWVSAYRPHDGKRGSVLEISGTEENLELACYVYAFLLGTAERLWEAHKRTTGQRSNRPRRAFLAGVMEGFRERLRAEQRGAEQRGLVWLGDSALRAYQRCRHPHVRSVRLRGHGGSEVRAQGRAAGRQIVLHRGVRARATERAAALPDKR